MKKTAKLMLVTDVGDKFEIELTDYIEECTNIMKEVTNIMFYNQHVEINKMSPTSLSTKNQQKSIAEPWFWLASDHDTDFVYVHYEIFREIFLCVF